MTVSSDCSAQNARSGLVQEKWRPGSYLVHHVVEEWSYFGSDAQPRRVQTTLEKPVTHHLDCLARHPLPPNQV